MLTDERPRAIEAKFRLLYLGNDLKLLTALRQVLPKDLYGLVACGDRETAELFLKSKIPYDLLLLDRDWHDSRGKDGLKLARLARSLGHRKQMPIILVTRAVSSRIVALARKSGVSECVMKLGDMGTVGGAIRRILAG